MENTKKELMVCTECGSDDLDMMTLDATIEGWHCNNCEEDVDAVTDREWTYNEAQRKHEQWRDLN